MARITIPDIARYAGVSTATVDRVLNRRPGVSSRTRQSVMTAALRLGYLPDDGQVVLPARPVRIEFFIPRRLQQFLTDVAERVDEFASGLPLVASIRLHDLADLEPATLVDALGEVSLDTDGVGLVAVDHPVTRRAVEDLLGSGVKVVTVASDILSEPRATHVGVDDRIAGRTAGLLMGRFCHRRAGPVVPIAGTRALHGQRQRELGFRSVLAEEFADIEVLPTIDIRSDNRIAETAVAEVMERRPDLMGLYCMGGGRSGLARAVAAARPERRPVTIMHDLSDPVRGYLRDGLIDAVLDQNARLVAEQSVTRMLASIAVGSRFLPVHYIEPRLILRENLPLL